VKALVYKPSVLLTLKEHSVPIAEEAGWAPEPAWALWRREEVLILAGSRCPDPSLVTVPSELFCTFLLLIKLNRVPRMPVVIMNYTVVALVKCTTAFLMARNWIPSRAI
jgi:hypothetical protein